MRSNRMARQDNAWAEAVFAAGPDMFTHTRYERAPGVGSKVGNSLKGLLMGPIVIGLGCLLLWMNEGWAIKTHRSLDEAQDAFVSLPDATLVGREYDNRLLHLSHQISVDSPPMDHDFGITRQNVVSLSRKVEIFQWVEHHKQERHKLQNGETKVTDTYSYEKQWTDSPVDSSNFHHFHGHENIGSLPYVSKAFRADGVKVGAYLLSQSLIRQLRSRNPVPVSEAKNLPTNAEIRAGAIYFAQNRHNRVDTVEEKTMTIDGQKKIMYTVMGETYSTREKALDRLDAASTSMAMARTAGGGESMIGDVRITFTEVPCTVVSVLAKSHGRMLGPWQSKQGIGYDVGILVAGQVSAHEMILSAQSSNNVFTWFKRFWGWLLTCIGFSLITQIVSTTADITLNWIPLFGRMATSIIDLGLTIANVVLSISLSLLVASVAWLFYRPILGGTLLAGSLGLFYAASQAGEKTKTKEYLSGPGRILGTRSMTPLARMD